jgi:hypothetical protein
MGVVLRFSLWIFAACETMPLQAVGARRLMGGPSSGMAQDSAVKRRHGDGGIGKIIFRRSCGELVVGFLDGVVSGSGSAFSVMEKWGMRDDAPPGL